MRYKHLTAWGWIAPQAVKVLRDMAAGRALDGDVVDTLTAHFDEINEVRVRTQAKTLLDYQEFNYSPS